MKLIKPVSWIKRARKDFLKFPQEAQEHFLRALDIAAQGQKSGIAKPLKGFGPGVFEISLRYSSGAYRIVYTVQIRDEIWVIHAFQKKSKKGIETPKDELDMIRKRLKKLKEMLS